MKTLNKLARVSVLSLAVILSLYFILWTVSPELAAQVRGVTEAQLTGLARTFTAKQTFKAPTNSTEPTIALEGGLGPAGVTPRISATSPATFFWTGTAFSPAVNGQQWGGHTNKRPDINARALTWQTTGAGGSLSLTGNLDMGANKVILADSAATDWYFSSTVTGMAAQPGLTGATQVLSTTEQATNLTGPRAYIAITFDDGHDEQYDNYRSVLNARGAKATFFINSNTVGTAGILTWGEIDDLIEDGHEIGDHLPGGESAQSLASGAVYELIEETLADVAANTASAYVPKTYSYPQNQYGDTTDGVAIPHIVQMFYEAARRSTDEATYYPLRNPYQVGGYFGPGAVGGASGNSAAITFYTEAGRQCTKTRDRACLVVFGIHGDQNSNIHPTDLATVMDTLIGEGAQFVTFAQGVRAVTVQDYRRNYVTNTGAVPRADNPDVIDYPDTWSNGIGNATYDFPGTGCFTMSDTDGGTEQWLIKVRQNAVWERERPTYFTRPLAEKFSFYDPNNADEAFVWRAPYATTLSDINCITAGSGGACGSPPCINMDLQECTSAGASCSSVLSAAIACDTNSQAGTITDTAIADGAWVKVVFGTEDGTVGNAAMVVEHAPASFYEQRAQGALPNSEKFWMTLYADLSSVTASSGIRIRLTGDASADCSAGYQTGTTSLVFECEGVVPASTGDGVDNAVQGWIQLVGVTAGSVEFCNVTIGVDEPDPGSMNNNG